MTSAVLAHPSTTRGHLSSALATRVRQPLIRSLMVLAALLVAGSGAIHFYLWDIAYRRVATLGPLFFVQGVSAVVVAVALIVGRWGAVIVVALGLMVGTLIGFALVLTTGLFGFKLGFVSGWATLALVVECAATVVLGACGALQWRDSR
jgi:hypothetical protein